MATITLSGLGKTYPGGKPAVSDIDLAIADGEFVVLVGPSGCGKSTLLRMIAGLETITTGTVRIGERVVNELEPAERDIAMVFQNYALYPHMTVRQNMAYGLKNRRMAKDEIARRVAVAAEMLEIAAFLDRKPRQLSGGQRQRVAMGRAIVREPAAFLFDEPLSNLDAKLRVTMRGEIRQLQRRLGTTSVYVTHDQIEAMTLADRLVVLNGGKIEQIGTPLEVYRQPATTFVAGFIGAPAMNLLRLDRVGSRLVLGEMPLPLAGTGDGPVLMGLRPEEIGLATGTAEVPLSLAVTHVEELGAQRLVHGRVAGQALVAALPAGAPIADRIEVQFDIAAAHLFDAATGRRLI